MDPFLEPPNGFVVALFNLCADAIQVVWRAPRALRPSDSGRARGGSLEESSSGHELLIAVKSARYNSNVSASLAGAQSERPLNCHWSVFNRKWTTKDDDACLSMCLPCPAGQRFSPEGTSENAQRFNLAERLLHP